MENTEEFKKLCRPRVARAFSLIFKKPRKAKELSEELSGEESRPSDTNRYVYIKRYVKPLIEIGLVRKEKVQGMGRGAPKDVYNISKKFPQWFKEGISKVNGIAFEETTSILIDKIYHNKSFRKLMDPRDIAFTIKFRGKSIIRSFYECMDMKIRNTKNLPKYGDRLSANYIDMLMRFPLRFSIFYWYTSRDDKEIEIDKLLIDELERGKFRLPEKEFPKDVSRSIKFDFQGARKNLEQMKERLPSKMDEERKEIKKLGERLSAFHLSKKLKEPDFFKHMIRDTGNTLVVKMNKTEIYMHNDKLDEVTNNLKSKNS